MCVWFFFYPTPCVIYFIFLVEFINWFNLYQRNVIINIKKRVLDRTYTVQRQQQPPKRQAKKIPKRQRQESIIFRRCYYWWWYVRKNLYSEITFDHSRLIFFGRLRLPLDDIMAHVEINWLSFHSILCFTLNVLQHRITDYARFIDAKNIPRRRK